MSALTVWLFPLAKLIPISTLAKPTDKISLLDVYLAVERNKPLFEIDHKTNPQCIVGGNIQETLSEYYNQAEIAAKAKLNDTRLSDVIDTILVKQKEKEYLQKQQNYE